jgi:hypothetical protein
MVADCEDYRTVRSLAVHAEDVVAAFETNRTPGPRAVLRVTPPFTGRMRARLHVDDAEEYLGTPRPLHIDPDLLLDVESLPAYPTAADTEDRLRADPDREYSIERHHEFHTDVVTAWREAAADAVVSTTELDGPQGSHRVRVLALG